VVFEELVEGPIEAVITVGDEVGIEEGIEGGPFSSAEALLRNNCRAK